MMVGGDLLTTIVLALANINIGKCGYILSIYIKSLNNDCSFYAVGVPTLMVKWLGSRLECETYKIVGSVEYEIGICCFSAKQAAVRSKSKARIKYVTYNTDFVFVTDTDKMEGGDLLTIIVDHWYWGN